MIVVRNVFQLKFGKSREALELWKEGLGLLKKAGAENSRLLTDAVAPFYTLVLENAYPGLAEFENFHKKATANADWKKWYEKFAPLVESGRREIFNIVA
ncbi:MAG: NIPSNAP family protein [candidate division Zixibacteria bacterium]|nr:NIPSNAP family protein [candidate division Zixibacteria bacterium]MCI0595074.1 NIPSNAP family protein [candidate division Zixibacteria bacterium]